MVVGVGRVMGVGRVGGRGPAGWFGLRSGAAVPPSRAGRAGWLSRLALIAVLFGWQLSPTRPAVAAQGSQTHDKVAAVAAGGAFSLALTASGVLYAWGYNKEGELGDGSTSRRTRPVRVLGLPDPRIDPPVTVAAGTFHTLALTRSGAVYAWGGNWFGELGDGSRIGRKTPMRVRGLPDPRLDPVVWVAAGEHHSLALTRSGAVYAWGANGAGQLGAFSAAVSVAPLRVPGLPRHAIDPVVSVAAGDYHSLALTRSGRIYAWGDDGDGELGDGRTISSPRPVLVKKLPNPAADRVTAVVAGGAHSVAITRKGVCYAWGDNQTGELGRDIKLEQDIGSYSSTAVEVFDEAGALASGLFNTVALSSAGTVYIWGLDTSSLSFPRTLPESAQVSIPNDFEDPVVAVAAGEAHGLALAQSGIVYAWGFNGDGELGNGSTSARSYFEPVRVQGLPAL